jgi:multiple sugar transport system ATP-binding protein
MDEPLSSLDAKLREELRLELKNIQVKLGATLLFVTHDHIEATTMADQIGVLKEGELIQFDTPAKIYNDPNSIYVAQKLGSPKINIISSNQLNSNIPNDAKFIGFRPENITLGQKGLLKAKIDNIQNLGVEQIVSLKLKDENIRALVKPDFPLDLNEDVHIDISKEHLLYFNKNAERIYPRSRSSHD